MSIAHKIPKSNKILKGKKAYLVKNYSAYVG